MVRNLALTHTRTIVGIDAPLVTVEAHISHGMPGFSMVGLPETAVRESKDRVRSAIINSRLTFPGKRLTVNLAPADLPKHGSRFDLAIAIAILAASGQIHSADLPQYEFMGELALSGALRRVPYGLIQSIASQKENLILFLPEDNAAEAQLSLHSQLEPSNHLLSVLQKLSSNADHQDKSTKTNDNQQAPNKSNLNNRTSADSDTKPQAKIFSSAKAKSQPSKQSNKATDRIEKKPFEDVIGQYAAKRALSIAAAGGHHCLLSGPPGVGKSMLARQFHRLLPPLAHEDALETLALYCCYRPHQTYSNYHAAPFRSPHHSASLAALIGGGNPPKPGEISLAHHGVLLLDELPEFSRQTLEGLREPMETGMVHISRAKHSVIFPAQCQLIATMNPCPCGYLGSKNTPCQCTPTHIQNYQKKLSGPLLDRFDLMVSMETPALLECASNQSVKRDNSKKDESNITDLSERITQTREKQMKRQGRLNAQLTSGTLRDMTTRSLMDTLDTLCTKQQLSMRGRDHCLRIAQTIADIDNQPEVSITQLLEALSYRPSPKHLS